MTERVLSVRLRAIVDGYEQAMGRAALATEKVVSTGKKMENAGRKMTVGFSAPMTAAGLFALRSATQFESAFAGVTKTVDGTAQEMAGLRSGIIDMARDLPSTREEISGVAAAAGQLGIQTPHILEFTRTMIDLGNSTDVAAGDAAMSLAQLANITKMSQSDFGRLGSSIVALGNNFPTTESRIIEMSQRLASAGVQIGLTEPQIVGFATALSSVGIDAEAGGTAISRVMIMIAQAVSKGGADLERWAQIAGMSSEAFANLFRSDSASAITAAVEGLGRLSETGGDLFGVMEEIGAGDVRVGNALRSLAGSGDLLNRTLELSTKAWDENSALTKEAGARYATTESRLKMTANRLTDVARKAGEAMFPAVNATLNIINPLAEGAGGLVETFTKLPGPLQAAAGSILAIGVASGPTIWALGKLTTLYAPVVTGMLRMAPTVGQLISGFQSWTSGIYGAAAAMRTAAITGQGMSSALLGMGAAIGPQLALAAAIAAVGAAIYISKKRADELKESHQSGADAAMQLAESAGLATQELKAMAEDSSGPAVFDEQFRRQNEEAVKSLHEIADLQGQLAYLREIGYGMVLRGVDPEQALEQVQRLAEISGITIPIDFQVGDISDVEAQIAASVERARRAAELQAQLPGTQGLTTLRMSSRLELENVARNAEQLWATDQAAEFVQLLGESEAALDGNARAAEHLSVKTLEALDPEGKWGLSTRNAHDLADALAQIAGPSSLASESQKQLVQSILDTAGAMEGGLTPQNLAAAAAQKANGESAADVAAKQADAAAAADGLAGATGAVAGAQGDAAASGDDFAAVLDKISANAAFARMDLDAGAAAAQAFSEAMDANTRTGARMSAGLQGGSAFKSLREGLTGEKAIAEIRDDVAKSTSGAASAVDRLGDAARRADPKMSALQIRLDALAAAGDAFSKSIDQSSMLDDQVASALNLGDAYRDFEKSYRRLPPVLDMTALAMGKVRPRQAEAIQNMLNLGKAARDYLATLIEMGRSDSEVAGEAAKMRDEYTRMFREMGMGEGQIRQYLEAMGLLPEQITTAIRVSGVEAARTRLEAYMQLLEGRIPAEVATSVIARLEADDVEGAAAMLADFARTHPAELQVDTSKLVEAEGKIADVQSKLWELPKDLDPLKAMLGEYSDAQQSALEAVMQWGDGVQAYLSQVAHDGNAQEIRDQAYQIRDAFLAQIGMGDQVGLEYDAMSGPAKAYLDLIGLSDWQIDSAINLSGDAEAMFRLQMYADMFESGEIPPEIRTEVLAAIDEGRLQDAANLLGTWREDTQDGMIDNPLVAQLLGDTTDAEQKVQVWRDWVSKTGHGTLTVDADTQPASSGVGMWFGWLHTQKPGSVTVAANTDPARGAAWQLGQDIQSMRPTMTVDVVARYADTNLPQLLPPLPGIRPGMGLPNTQPGAPGSFFVPRSATGGRVRGPGSDRSDSIYERRSNDEFVMQAWAARAIGYDRLDQANRTGTLPTNQQFLPVMPDMDAVMDRAAAKIARQIPAGGDHLEFSGDIVAPSPKQVPRRISEAVGTGRFLTRGTPR